MNTEFYLSWFWSAVLLVVAICVVLGAVAALSCSYELTRIRKHLEQRPPVETFR